MDTGRLFTASEIAECAKEAKDNWDFDQIENRSQKYISAMKEALDFDEEYAQELWCEDGPMDLDSAYTDIWDFLDEFANGMASQI
jgi:hypothetical protein